MVSGIRVIDPAALVQRAIVGLFRVVWEVCRIGDIDPAATLLRGPIATRVVVGVLGWLIVVVGVIVVGGCDDHFGYVKISSHN